MDSYNGYPVFCEDCREVAAWVAVETDLPGLCLRCQSARKRQASTKAARDMKKNQLPLLASSFRECG
jgi:hypothetical protein